MPQRDQQVETGGPLFEQAFDKGKDERVVADTVFVFGKTGVLSEIRSSRLSPDRPPTSTNSRPIAAVGHSELAQ